MYWGHTRQRFLLRRVFRVITPLGNELDKKESSSKKLSLSIFKGANHLETNVMTSQGITFASRHWVNEVDSKCCRAIFDPIPFGEHLLAARREALETSMWKGLGAALYFLGNALA